MALRAKKPVANGENERLKLLMFSDAGIGKTTAAAQFPRVYFVDTEKGADKKQYTEAILAGDGVYFGADDGATDPDEVTKEVEALTKTHHDYRTLVIDSFTTLYEAKYEQGVGLVGADWGKASAYADRWAKKLFRLLTLLDMNIIVTSHAKDTWSKGERTGQTADGFKKQRFLFDLVLQLERVGTKRIATVDKTRFAEFPDRDRFEWSYEELERRWGQARMNRESTPAQLATPEQIAQLVQFFDAVNLSKEDRDKFLEKSGVDEFADLTSEVAASAIERCRKQLAKVMETTQKETVA